MNLYITILLEFLLISSSILLLFKFRTKLGLAPLYILLGTVQYLQANLGSSFSFNFWGDYEIYPGSIILFSGVLFAVLLIYIKEGVASARALIVGIILSNAIMTFMFEITYIQQIINSQINNTSINTNSVFNINFKYFFSGTVILFLDYLLLVIIYQYLISKVKKLPFFLILFISLFSVLIFDAITFNVALFYGTPLFKTSLISHLLGKSISALVFSTILYLYMKYFDNEITTTTFIANQDRDVFSIIKYRKRFKDLEFEKEQVELKLTSQLETTLHNISDGFISLDTNWCYTYLNKKAAVFLGKPPESLIGKHIWTEFPEGVGLPLYDAYNKAAETQETIVFESFFEPLNMWFKNRVYPSPDGLTIYFTDITEQKNAELALKESEQHLRTILETEPECIKQLNSKGELIYMNPAGLAMVEADKLEDVKGHSVINLISPNHQYAFKKLTSNVFKGNPGLLEFEIKGLKGTKRWLETHAVPLKDSNGNIISLLGVTRDVTDRKETDTNNQMLLSLIETSESFIGLAALDGKPIYLNDKGRKLVGLEAEEKAPTSILDFFPKQYQSIIQNEHMPAIFENEKWNGEVEFENFKTGDLIPIEMSSFLIKDNKTNNPIALGIVATDITKRKEVKEQIIKSEKYLDNIINNIGDPVFVKDEQSRLVLVNDAFCAIFNTSKTDIIGKTLAKNVHPDEHEVILRIDKQVIATGIESVNEGEMTINENETCIISTKKTRFIDSGDNKFIIAVIRDITENKKAEKEILALGNRNTQIIKTLLDGFLLADSAGKILDANPAYLNMTGYTLDELLTMNINQLEAVLNQKQIDERINEMVSNGFARFHSNHKKKNGEIINLDVNTFTMQIDEQLVVAAFIKDITDSIKSERALKESEEKFSKAFDSNVIGKAILNKEKRIIEVNDALANIVGFKRENMLEKTAEEIGLFNFDSQENLENEKILWSQFSEKGYASNIELQYLMQGGKVLFIQISLQALQLNNEDHVLITVIDITDKKNVEAELEKHRNNLEELVELRTEEVNTKNDELQRMNKLFVGRELRMKELKNIIKEGQSKNDN